MMNIGTYAVPVIVCFILVYGYLHGVRVFDVFLEGAKEGIQVSMSILPALIALVTAVGMFKASGGLDVLSYALAPVANLLGIPQEVIPLVLLRPISGSGAMVIFTDIIKTYGSDSFIGRVASVMQGSTETTFYTVALYYGAAKIKNTRHTIPAALCGDLTGFVMSALLVRLMFLN
ncbi:spore maturation protein [Youxingia wuxianensis]|uniref:Spore maturation protein n=1 Tax=Youxingia wuxianensis TaxID=2763678 RepID=A0A926ETK2_9FIRM|nr:nucleoside recognition domain-containing protein [Youxingia wuxianensis]MBC8586357.1 spore maturation protein [Youxingia wuxianensis]